MKKHSRRYSLFEGLDSLDELTEAGWDYVNLRKDAFKLRLIEDLSVLCNRLFGLILIVIVASAALFFFALGLHWWLGQWLHSQGAASIIIGVCFLALLALLYIYRDRLFLNGMISTFSALFFQEAEEEDEDDE
jgi:hypothetical protein